ncbi:helix-turn-helix transcriptional regulator [Desulfotomaculum varum]
MKVKQLRESQGLSQKALAEKAGVAQATVHYIESGGNATQKTLQKIATALGVSVSKLLEDDEIPKASNE